MHEISHFHAHLYFVQFANREPVRDKRRDRRTNGRARRVMRPTGRPHKQLNTVKSGDKNLAAVFENVLGILDAVGRIVLDPSGRGLEHRRPIAQERHHLATALRHLKIRTQKHCI